MQAACDVSWEIFEKKAGNPKIASRLAYVSYCWRDSIDPGRRQFVRCRPAIACGIEVLVPVRRNIVIRVHFLRPRRVGHRRPMILVESRRIFEPILAPTENEALIASVERQRGPRNRKELGTHAQKAAEGKDRVGDATAGDIEHERLDLAKVFAAGIDDAVAYQRCRVHDFRARAIRAPTFGADNRRAAGGLGRPRGGIRINACGHKMSPRGKMLGSACRREASTGRFLRSRVSSSTRDWRQAPTSATAKPRDQARAHSLEVSLFSFARPPE